MLLKYFFFFQAEDGIRDTSVTGVQTCALPISWWGGLLSAAGSTIGATGAFYTARLFLGQPLARKYENWLLAWTRSEERRVGKECRSGLAVEREQKKVRSSTIVKSAVKEAGRCE